ncbi:hypothetical protein [Formosa sp. S-31]|uniref:hypothetical protein n=1 Tax=Formosa sp. S-31 TaxID=2790949 RepID=UPI003EB74230
MKKILVLIHCFIALTAVVSCNDEGYDDPIIEAAHPDDLAWQATTSLQVTPVSEMGNFVYETYLETNEEIWGVADIAYDIQINSNISKDQFSKIEFYLTMQEENGYNYTTPFDYSGTLIATQTEWNDEGLFTLTVNAEEAYGKFINKLQFDRSDKLPREGDLFEIHWVIYNKDGDTLDSRKQSGSDQRFTFTTKFLDIAPPIWAGTFNYEWIEATTNASNYGRINVGDTGTVTITQLEGQTYYMENLMFGYYYSKSGKIIYNYTSGLVAVESQVDEKWNVVKIDGASIDIALEYRYSTGYNEYCTVRLTRTDGKDWPTIIHTN